MNKRTLQAFHQLATCNREALREAGTGICVSCAKHVDVDAITEWIDDGSLCSSEDRHTAVCPHCGADALVPDFSARLVATLHALWF